MIKLRQVQIDALKMMIQIARSTHMDVDIKYRRPDIISQSIQISTSEDDQVIDDILNGEYLEAPHFDVNTFKSLSDLFNWERCYHADVNGWISLFNETNASEDGRWFMKITNEESGSTPAITLYRKEPANLVKIVTFRKDADDAADVRIYPEINNPTYNWLHMSDYESINDDQNGLINHLTQTIGIYAGLVMDVLNSVLTKINKASN